VTPTVVPGNPSCSHLNSGWTDFKPVDNNPNDEGDATPPPPPGGGDNGGGGDSGGGSNNTPPPSDTTPPSDASGKAPAADSGQAPAEEPGAQAVLGERIAGGTARLFSVSGCASRPFSARVFGRGISRVVFVLDGNGVATLHRPNRNGSYSLRINPARYARVCTGWS
jgi:hypothetical protein